MHHYLDVWKKFAVFSGRTTRTQYWMFILFHYIVIMALLFASMAVSGAAAYASEEYPFDPFSIAYLIYSLAVVIPSLAVTVRRLHDTGRSGFWYFVGFIPFLGGLVLLFFMLQGSEPGDNQYGPAETIVAEVFD